MDQNTPANPNTPNSPKPIDKRAMIGLAMELGYIIALPIVALGFLGKWLDGKYDVAPAFTLTGIVLAIICTTVWLMKKFKDFVK